ncbi:hypothetical protein [Weeksella virosa]|uniref:hypothetical protein n=1 Tax=Weeksella virosa TaxID=1014 RepID=UPI002554D9CC|nr:hypothetical protein [Weeksella virosa]
MLKNEIELAEKYQRFIKKWSKTTKFMSCSETPVRASRWLLLAFKRHEQDARAGGGASVSV